MGNIPEVMFLPSIRRDIQEIDAWTERTFGQLAADRYNALLSCALRDLRADPLRLGTRARPDLADAAYMYHLAFSRDRVVGEQVKSPRHFILYRFTGTKLEFARILHDSRDLARHLPAGYKSSE